MSNITRGVAALVAATGFVVAAPVVPATHFHAVAQERVEISAGFRTALEPYGEFRLHQRWGEVWVPTHVAENWEPYTVGHWVDTNDYGWYWVSDQSEAPWGWVAFHYGRWVFDDEMGWVWVPGRVWGPGFVNWRRGGQRGAEYVGWAPEPPDDVIVEVRDDPRYWVFVRAPDFLAPRIVDVVVPPRERIVLIRETVVENRTVFVRDRGFAVNPGIPPAFVAAAVGRPITTYRVRPVVFAGTANLPDATIVRADELRQRRNTFVRESVAVQPTNNVVQPTANVPPPRPLPPNARQGRLDLNPPRAVQGATTGAAPAQGTPPVQTNPRAGAAAPERQPGAAPPAQRPSAATPQMRPGERPGQPPTTSGQAPSRELERERGAEQNRPGARERGGPIPRNPAQAPDQRRGTTGAAPPLPREPNLGNEPRRGAPELDRRAAPQPPAQVPDQRRGTTGAAPPSPREPNLGNEPRRGPPGLENRAAPREPTPRGPDRSGTTGAAPSPSRPSDVGVVPRREPPGLQSRPTQREPSLQGPSLREPGRRPDTTGAAPREPAPAAEPRRQTPGLENRMPPREQGPRGAAPQGRPPLATERSPEPGARGPMRPSPAAPAAPAAQGPRMAPPSTTGAGPRGGDRREERR